jgi:hypothetical protein
LSQSEGSPVSKINSTIKWVIQKSENLYSRWGMLRETLSRTIEKNVTLSKSEGSPISEINSAIKWDYSKSENLRSCWGMLRETLSRTIEKNVTLRKSSVTSDTY